MIRLEQLYADTRQGLDIILYYYPQAEACVEEPKRKFKVRDSERTPSAVLLAPDAKHAYYRVCDFGDEGHGLSPIDIAMKVEAFTQNRFAEMVLRLAQRHNVRDELNRSVNTPRTESREALPTEKEGDRPFRLLPRIPDEHLKIFGPRVAKEHVDALHWHEAEYIGYVKNGRVALRYSTPNYPIFMRECQTDEGKTFFKVYEPMNPEKQFRFTYTPRGVKPKQYINGWRELLQRLAIENAQREPEDPEVKTIPEAFICSGERDAICCLSMGGQPLWFNSETYTLQPAEYEMIRERVDTLYNIPDIDATGQRRGAELALRYMDIRTLWLPDWLLTYRDNRGHPRKDLRDWMELRASKYDFTTLRDTAIQARFWDRTTRDKKTDYSISSVRLYYFLHLHGFRTLHDEDSDLCRYIRLDGNTVQQVRARDVRRFVREWAEDKCLGEQVRNLIVNSMKFSEASLENLREVELNFTNFTPRSQTLFFENTTVEVSDTGIREYRKGDEPSRCYVWAANVVPHRFRLLPVPFTATRRDNGTYAVQLRDTTSSPLLGFLINASRLYWRQEMETRFLADGDTPEARQRMKDYAFFHRFTLDGDGLTPDEVAEQQQCLVNKLFAIGYLLHRYKTPSRPWAAIALDNKIGDHGECNGRSGKSFLFRTLAMFMGTVTLSGRNPRLMDNPHVFDQVSRHTDLVLIDDCAQFLPLSLFFDLITSDMTVNPKNNRSFTIPFALSPKFAFSTNYVPADLDSSSVARSLYVVFSDYYHERTAQNGYRESRRIADDFGFDLYGEQYTPEQWNADINVLVHCLAFYLSLAGTNTKIQPPMANIFHRMKLQEMGDNFQDWADSYFAPEGDHLNRFLVRREVFEHFRCFANTQRITVKSFTRKLRAYCDLAPHIRALNPVRLQNSQGRIFQRYQNRKEEMIYIEADDPDAPAADAESPTPPCDDPVPF